MLRHPSVSLCLIAKNEAEFIIDCLDSVREAVDEMIVVDTGSTDGTRKLAQRAGAHVFHFEWRNDFAAARNASLDRAGGDWVLWLDADERLAPGGARAIREAVARDDFDCGLLSLHNASRLDATPADVLSGRARLDDPVIQRRLLRRTPDLRFKGLVHEHLGLWLDAAPRKTQVVPADILHLGYVPEVLESRGKQDRNLRLLERQARCDPGDFPTYGYLAHAFLLSKRPAEAWQAVEVGWALLVAGLTPSPIAMGEGGGEGPPGWPHDTPLNEGLMRPLPRSVVRLAAIRVQMQLGRDDPRGAIETLREAERVQGGHPDFDYLRGEAHAMQAIEARTSAERRQQWQWAERAYRAALDKQHWVCTDRYVTGSAGYRARVGLGAVALHQGSPEQARECFEAAAHEAPGCLEAQLGRARALIALDDREQLLGLLQALEGTREKWLVAAVAAEYLGAIEEFAVLLEHARQVARDERATVRELEAIEACYLHLVAYQGRPRRGPGATGTVCAFLAGEAPGRAAPELDPWDRRQVELLLRNLARLGRGALIEQLVLPGPDRALPGVTAAARKALAGLGSQSTNRGFPL